MTPHGWLPYMYMKKNLVVCARVCRSCSSWNHITINNFLFRTEVSTTRLSNRMSYTCSYVSFRCQTPICCSHAWVWRIPKFRHLSPWFPNGEFPQFSTDLLGQHLFNLLQPSKKKQQQKMFCSAISNCYTKLVWFLGKNLAGVTKKQKPWVSTTLAYKLSTLSSLAWNEHDPALGPTMQQCRIHSFWSCGFWSKPLGKPLLQLPSCGEVLQHDS